MFRAGLNGIAEQVGASRVGEYDCRLGIGRDDEVVRHIGASLLRSLRRPDEINQLFIDYVMLALTAPGAGSFRLGLEDDYLVSLNLTITRAASFGSAASVSPRPISERAQGTCMT